MGNKLLVKFIRLAVKEAHLARVPNQLISTDDHDGTRDEDDKEDGVNEFCGIGGAAAGSLQGFNAPLGAGSGKKRKRKS